MPGRGGRGRGRGQVGGDRGRAPGGRGRGHKRGKQDDSEAFGLDEVDAFHKQRDQVC